MFGKSVFSVKKYRIIPYLLITLSILAVNANASGHYLGIQGGWNSSTLSEDENSKIERTNNYLIGVVGVFSLTPWLSFQPELLYSVKGASGEATYSTHGSNTIQGTATLSYFEIPMLLRVMYPNERDVIPHVFGGPAIAANWTAEANGMWGSRTVNGDIQELVTNGDIAFVFGGGIDFGFKESRISIDVRYTHGLISADDTCRFEELKNRVWTVSAALLLKVGEKH